MDLTAPVLADRLDDAQRLDLSVCRCAPLGMIRRAKGELVLGSADVLGDGHQNAVDDVGRIALGRRQLEDPGSDIVVEGDSLHAGDSTVRW